MPDVVAALLGAGSGLAILFIVGVVHGRWFLANLRNKAAAERWRIRR